MSQEAPPMPITAEIVSEAVIPCPPSGDNIEDPVLDEAKRVDDAPHAKS